MTTTLALLDEIFFRTTQLSGRTTTPCVSRTSTSRKKPPTEGGAIQRDTKIIILSRTSVGNNLSLLQNKNSAYSVGGHGVSPAHTFGQGNHARHTFKPTMAV